MLPALRRLDPITTLRREMDRLFERTIGPFMGEEEDIGLTAVQYPADVREDEKNIYVDAEVPGFKKEEIQASCDRGMLRIIAEHKAEERPKGEPQQIERRYRRIERAFTLPEEVDTAKVDASLENGVLHMTLPKSEQRKLARIAIH